MLRYALLSAFTLLCCSPVIAQDSLQATIILIGDAGQLTNGKQPVISSVIKNIPLDAKSTVIFLGDNLYSKGLPDNTIPTYAVAKAPLDSQIVINKGKDAKVYFIPGNHDWANGASTGYESILRVQAYIDFLGNDKVKMFPRDGCPGPVEVKINEEITLVMIDSEWWLEGPNKPGIESDCDQKTEAEVLSSLDDILSQNSRKLVLLATHHPFKTYGPHGGYFTLKQHIFPFTDINPKLYIPLPVIGSAYPLTRAVFGTTQDLKHPLYQNLIHKVTNVVNKHQNVIFVSGHEHTLQVIQDSSYNYLVSGAGSKTNRVSKGPNSLFAAQKNGYMTLQISKNKNVIVNVYEVEDSVTKEVFTKNILNFSTIDPPEAPDTLRKVEFVYKDSVLISASDKYKFPSGFRKVVLGNNYRKEWSTPVMMKVFNINKEHGGFTIESLGGGKQTKSLKLKDKNGEEWALRSIDKDPEKAIPASFRGTFAANIVQDAISASHPYAPLTVPVLAKAENVLQSTPRLFFVPNDPSFGIYQKTFANSVVMLEQRDPTPDHTDSKSTFTVINKLYDDNDNHVKQGDILEARILDMLIGDFDRHADQWKWGVSDTGKGKLYYPIPRDRDQAYFYSDGLLINLVSFFSIPYLNGFKEHFHNINKFNTVAKDFDRIFLNGLSEQNWDTALSKFQNRMTDDVIEKAMKQFPPEIYAMDGKVIGDKLKSRRNEIKKEGMKYYKFLAKSVTISGSNKNEFFHVQNDKGQVQVSVFKKKDESDSTALMYRRTFDPKETKELIFFGLNGEDKFTIDPDVNAKMDIRIVGGKGKDTFQLQGRSRKFIYDLNTEKNYIQYAQNTRNYTSANPAVLNYTNNDFKYNRFVFPLLNAGYNAEDKFLIGLAAISTTHGFRKDPFKTNQKLSTLFAPFRNAYQVNYKGEFTGLILRKDLVVQADYFKPTLNNFFGYGNESYFDKTKPLSYYRVRYQSFKADVLLRNKITSFASFSIGPSFIHYGASYADNDKRIISNSSLYDSASIFHDRDYAGGKFKFDVDYIDNPLFPKRGITWYTNFVAVAGVSKLKNDLTRLESDMTIYANVTGNSKVTAILRFGGGKIFSKDPQYFQLLTQGAENYNRGYRKNRFAGDGSAYTGAEIRYRLFKSHSYILPGEFGLQGFYDIGRVWLKGENSRKWHDSYGGGVYFAPFNIVLVSALVGFSPESQLFNFTIGSKFNLTF